MTTVESKWIPIKQTLLTRLFFFRTSLSIYLAMERFDTVFVPTVFDSVIHHEIDGKTIEVCVWDTSDSPEMARLRPLGYPKTDAILICYAVNRPESLKQAQDVFVPEARRYCPKVPLLLIGLKKDLRQQEGVSVEQATMVAQLINAYTYLECSAKTGDGVKQVLDQAVRAALEHSHKTCCIVL